VSLVTTSGVPVARAWNQGAGSGAGHPPDGVEADQIGVAGNARHDILQPRRALETDRFGRQGPQQDLGAGHARIDRGGAALGGADQGGALQIDLALKRQSRLQGAEQKHRRQGGGQDQAQTDSDRGVSPPVVERRRDHRR